MMQNAQGRSQPSAIFRYALWMRPLTCRGVV
jgi:hypothetical protein